MPESFRLGFAFIIKRNGKCINGIIDFGRLHNGTDDVRFFFIIKGAPLVEFLCSKSQSMIFQSGW
ncbi:MAG: hypothetical protein R3A45_05910 [Bdellovibrionota bacterium]